MKAIHRFWTIGLTSPLIYLVICVAVDRGVFVGREHAGFRPMDLTTYNALLLGLALSGAAVFPLILLLKSKWVMSAPDAGSTEAGILDSPRGKRFLALFMMSDTVALTGLILFLIQGKMSAMLLFGILGLVNYAAAYPGGRKERDEG